MSNEKSILLLSVFFVLSFLGEIQAVENCDGLNSPGNPFLCTHSKGDGNCTWYARYKRPDTDGICMGNASYWYDQANNGDLVVGEKVSEGSIVVYNSRMTINEEIGEENVGHVAYVENILDDGSFDVTEMGWETWDGVHANNRDTDDFDDAIGFIYPVGVYEDHSNDDNRHLPFITAYKLHSLKLGYPEDRGGKVFVHDWNGVWIQDLQGDMDSDHYDGSSGESAIILNHLDCLIKVIKMLI